MEPNPAATPTPSLADAERIFLEWLERSGSEDAEGLEDLCRAHPALADSLRAHLAAYERTVTLLARVREASRGETSGPMPGRGAGQESRYELRGEIARGGMGAILEVSDASLRRTIAMKILREDAEGLSSSNVRRGGHRSRLLAEAQILGQLDHPGVVAIHEVGLDDHGRPYFTMKRVRGVDLGVVFRAFHEKDPAWTLARVVELLVKIAETLAYAHSKGVIHRDLKPSNVMVGRFGEAFLMDWGLAKVIGRAEPAPLLVHRATLVGRDGPAGLAETGSPRGASLSVHTDRESDSSSSGESPWATMHGDVIGTPPYMPPEQARGEVESTDARSDVYAFGALLYELLAGRAPYSTSESASPRELVGLVLAGAPRPLSELVPHASEELVAISEKAMAREPARRYPTMLELAEDLRAWLEGRVVRAHATGAWTELSKWVGRNRWAAATIGTMVLALGMVVILQALSSRRVRTARDAADARAEELRQQDAVSSVALAGFALSVGDHLRARHLLDSCPPDLRRWEWHYLSGEIDTSDMTIRVADRKVVQAAFTPDGNGILAATQDDLEGGDNRVTLWDARTGRFLREIARFEGNTIQRISLSADGSLLAVFGPAPDLRLYRTDDWSALPGLEVWIEPGQGACFAPRSHGLAAYGRAHVEIWDVDRRERLARLDAGESEVADVAWSIDGERLFAASHDGRVRAWSAPTHELLATLVGHQDRVLEIEASPDGRFLASGGRDQRVIVRAADTLEPVYSSENLGDTITALAWRPDSGQLAIGLGATVTILDTGGWERVAFLQGLVVNVHSIEFDAAGKRILTAGQDGTARLWDLTRHDRQLARGRRAIEVAGLDFAPDGATFAVAYVDGQIEIWDAARREVLRSLRPVDALDRFAWSAASKRFAIAAGAGPVTLVDAETGGRVGEMPGPCRDELQFSPNGERLAIPGTDGTLRVFDVARAAMVWEARGYSGPLVGPNGLLGGVYSPDGTLLATCAASGEVQLWDARTGALVRERKGAAERYLSVGFSPDGERLCLWTLYPPATEMWDVETLSRLWIDEDDRPTPALCSPDPERLFTVSTEGDLGVWDARRGRMITMLDAPLRMPRSKLALASDGGLVVTAGAAGVRFWEPRGSPGSSASHSMR